MKYIDKFLKVLKTDRNTFATYLLTLVSIYILVDRLVEVLMMCFTGISVSYWGPIGYTIALACPVFAFLFSGSSKFAANKNSKIALFNVYCMALYIVGISMVIQWVNALCWLLLLSVPNYVEIITEFSELVKPAFQALALYIPLTTFYGVFKYLFFKVNDVLDLRKAICDYGGISLSDKSKGWGPYTCEVEVCTDRGNGKPAKIPESRRYESMIVVGVSGSGKTSMVYEPMIARDMEKKNFFKEASKELGITALRTGLAHLTHPYDNEYLNRNFSLKMLTPTEGKEKLYKAFMSKMIMSTNTSDGFVYRNLGLTYMSPDFETISHMVDVAENFGLPYHLIDPENPGSPGLNPFVYEDPSKTAIAISSVLRGMYNTIHTDAETAYREHTATQAIENLSILLKEMYPRLHEGVLPTLEDMLKMLNNFDLVEDMCNKLEASPELADKYSLQLGYFKKYFYQSSDNRKDTEKFVHSAISQLDNLLRIDSVRNILCNRVNNIDYDKVLENGEITFVCTRRGDLGATANKAFGLFFLLVMQYSVLRRPGNENSRIPHFLYIDEFPDYICNATDSIFTLYRKYRVGTIISAQNLAQLAPKENTKYRDTILANCTSKVVFGNNTPEDNAWWQKEMGDHREWKYTNDYKTDKVEYDSTYKGAKWEWKENIKAGKLQALKFKNCAFKTKDLGGKNVFVEGIVDFLDSKYKEPYHSKTYDFSKYTNGIAEDLDAKPKKEKFDPTHVDFSSDGEIDPIQYNTTDSSYLLNNDDAIVFDFKKNKK